MRHMPVGVVVFDRNGHTRRRSRAAAIMGSGMGECRVVLITARGQETLNSCVLVRRYAPGLTPVHFLKAR